LFILHHQPRKYTIAASIFQVTAFISLFFAWKRPEET
jgi:hypothetical protein